MESQVMDSTEITASSSCVRCTFVYDYVSKRPADKPMDSLSKQYTCHTCHDLDPDFYATICAAAETNNPNLPRYKAVEFRSGYGYDPNEIGLESLREAVENGCASCRLVGMGVASFFQELVDRMGELNAGSKIALNFGSRLAVQIILTDGKYSTGYVDAFEFYTTGTGCPWPAISGGNHIPEELDLNYCIAKVLNWVRHCDREHKHHCRDIEPPKLPKRVLDLNGGNTENDLSLKETNGLSDRYVTLSHCWGQAVPSKTTKLNAADHMINIKLTSLSKTFQDTIALTRGLGIRYLWIDSLCILQDDIQDWQIESAKMAAIYSNSFLNLAATHAVSGDHGLFSSRWREFEASAGSDEVITSRTGINAREIRFQGDNSAQIYVRPSLSSCHDDLFPWLSQYPSLKAAPLLTRGWCLQERLLAPRTLHFHATELFFECNTHCLCECGLPERLQQYEKSGCRLLHFASDNSSSSSTAQESLQLWMKICGSHASLRLTKSTDRLPALAGLASAFAKNYGWRSSEYLAGLWRAHLPAGLLWRVHGSHTPKLQRAVPFLAPTWSWASLHASAISEYSLELLPHEGKGGPFEADSRFRMSFVECEVEGENPYGEVAVAVMGLCGAFVRPSVVVSAAWHSIRSYELRFSEETAHGEDDMDYLFFVSDSQLQDLFMQRWRPFPFYCLLIGSGAGLVLEPSRTTSGAYERVGFFSGGDRFSRFENVERGEFVVV